ncbi:MAG: hypothetical protein QM809_03055 [Gordonia sp. (in: high G+C Gram-positive bacteria)]|uniref:uridine kinase family protein n=1 Tax=Gordonia sp. (in: high G+C Gram-positive bacteria) TaxID=84139 RepID=UPI0039E2C6BA
MTCDDPATEPIPGLTEAARAAIESNGFRNGILAIDGPSGSGKSSFADALVARLAELGRPPLLIRTDDYATWDRPASWWPELERDVLTPFSLGHDIAYRPRVWHCGEATVGPVRRRAWSPLLILEGVTSARRVLADRVDHAFWIDGPSAPERLERTVTRDGEAQRPLLAAWQRFESGWFAVDGTRARCDVIDFGEGENPL